MKSRIALYCNPIVYVAANFAKLRRVMLQSKRVILAPGSSSGCSTALLVSCDSKQVMRTFDAY